MSDKITLLSHRYALEQRIRVLKTPELTEGKDTKKLMSRLTAMLEQVNQQIEETGLPQDQITSSWPMDNPVLPQRIPVSEYDSHPDHEVQMARSELYRAAKCAISLEKMLKHINEQQGLEGWVQAKITKAADYLESVYHYMDYEMRSTQEESIGEAVETVRPYGSYKPGQQAGESIDADSPSPSATPINKPAGPGQASAANPNQPPEPAEPGQMSATPPSGGATPVPTAPGHVKVIRVGPDGQPTNDAPPLTIPQTDLENKQKMGYRVAEDASGGASSAGSMGGGFGNGFANGGPGSIMRRKPRKKKAVGEAEEKKKVVHCSQCGKGFNAAGLKPPHHTGFSHCKDHKGMKIVAEATFNPNISTPTSRAQAASRFGHDPDRAAPMYKANKYNPETGLGGYVAPRGDTTDKSNILLQLKANLDTATSTPLYFQDGSTLEIRPSIARTALSKIDAMRPVEKHETIKNLMTSKDAFVGFVRGQGESKEETGTKFTGYWKGKDKGKPGKKMVGDA